MKFNTESIPAIERYLFITLQNAQGDYFPFHFLLSIFYDVITARIRTK